MSVIQYVKKSFRAFKSAEKEKAKTEAEQRPLIIKTGKGRKIVLPVPSDGTVMNTGGGG